MWRRTKAGNVVGTARGRCRILLIALAAALAGIALPADGVSIGAPVPLPDAGVTAESVGTVRDCAMIPGGSEELAARERGTPDFFGNCSGAPDSFCAGGF